MGTTRTALQSSSGLTYQTVVAIEGLSYLLTDGPTARAVTAWAGTDWSQALGGLFTELQRQGDWDPFNAFTDGGTLTLTVAPDALDILGKQIGLTSAGAVTQLDATVDAIETTITVKSTAGFAASGEAFCGTECFAYSGVTATTFTGVTRGRYSPYLTNGGDGFGRQHRAGLVSTYQTSLHPIVSQNRRSWSGALMGVWIHRVVDGVLDTKAEAQLVFAGTVVDLFDAGETTHTVIVCKDILDRIKGASLMRDTFRARIVDGLIIEEGATFEFREGISTATLNEIDPLVCVAGAPADHREFQAGLYTVTELCSVLNEWLTGELLINAYSIDSPIEHNGAMRTVMTWEQNNVYNWHLEMPANIACFLGIIENVTSTAPVRWDGIDFLSQTQTCKQGSPFSPRRWLMGRGNAVQLTDVQGVFVDQYDLMPFQLGNGGGLNPGNIKPPTSGGDEWGVFVLNGEPFVTGVIDEDSGTYTFSRIREFLGNQDVLAVRYEVGAEPPSVELSQIFAIRATFAELVLRLFASTGTPGHNHATYDELPLGLSLGIPWEALGAGFEASVNNMPEADRELTLVVTQSISLEKLINVDLVLRGVHLVWRNQGLALRRWQTPTAGLAVAALTEANKAMPAGNRGTFRTTTKITTAWLTPIVSIVFDRNWRDDKYAGGPLILEDRTSIDDMGGDAPTKKLEARNMTREDIEAIAPLFLELAQFFSRPAYVYQRTIDQRLYETLAPGDVVTVTDAFARNPATGNRGMAGVPGLAFKVGYSLGGPEPGDPTAAPSPQVGTVDVLVFPFERPALYSPAGQLDHTVSGGGFSAGYNSGTNTIRLVEHAYTAATGAADASFFVAGDEIEITEVDPDDPASPQSWTVTVSSVSSNDLVIDEALTGFDSGKKYRIRSQIYTAAQLSQLANAYEADSTDNKIVDTAEPYTYGLTASDQPDPTLESAPWPSELLPEMSYGDGAAHDSAMDVQLARALNNLMSHKTAINSPIMHSPSALGHTTASTRRILRIMPKCFGRMRSTAVCRRHLSVSPFFRSSNGTSCTITVTLVGSYPKCTGFDNQTFDEPSSSASWTTSSTTWSAGAAAELDLSVLGEDGIGFLIIEGTDRLETFGLAQCSETEIA